MKFLLLRKVCSKSGRLLVETLLVMKLSVLIILATVLQVNATPATGQIVSLDVTNAPLKSVFSVITEQTHFHFIYSSSANIDQTSPVTMKVVKAKLDDALNRCFQNQSLTYRLDTVFKQVIVFVRKTTDVSSGANISPEPKDSIITIRARIVTERDEPLSGATISIKGTATGTSSNEEGEFVLPDVPANATVTITHIGYGMVQFKASALAVLSTIHMREMATTLGAIVVPFNNGYETIAPERSTGSYDVVDNKLINRSVTTSILGRIENLTPGTLFNHGDAASTDQILIRGRSTILGNAAPLIVLNDFPYDGDLNDINPNDVESITILKDAGAASIWGARAGNGVIVIVTKRGKTVKPQVEINSNITVQSRPNLFNVSTISSSDEIDLEEYLYTQGYYKSAFTPPYYQPTTPVVNLLQAEANGTIGANEANAEIAAMKTHDVRNDESKYLYRTATSQQDQVNVSGNTASVNYYLSAGLDHDITSLVGSKYDRFTIRSQNTFKVSQNIDVDASLNYVQEITQNGDNPGNSIVGGTSGKSIYPYAQLVDANGNPQPIYLDYNQLFVQNREQQGLLNWTYNPIGDIYNESHQVKTRDYVIGLGSRYRIVPGLTLGVKYRYENQLVTRNDLYSDSSYYARNFINMYAQINGGTVTFPIPVGGILNIANTEIASNQGRAQLDFTHTFNQKHHVDALAGWEIRSLVTTANSSGLYGYSPDNSSIVPTINYGTSYLLSTRLSIGKIPNNFSISKSTDHFLSYFGNLAYTYDNRYTITGSARKDEANLFGVSTNLKGAPLWSTGAAWTLSNEKFYGMRWLPFLKLRATYGYNGNITRQATAFTTASAFPALTNSSTRLAITAPPNSKLKWEEVQTLNLGLDFGLVKNILAGTIEYYRKNDKDLLAKAPVDPTLGLSTFYGNIASMFGKGIDLQLNSNNLRGALKWTTNLIFSYSTSKVTQYELPVSTTGNTYLSVGSSFINPVKGKPLFAYYSYRWGGLDPTNGDPLGYYNGKASNAWSTIAGQTPLDSMVYNGPATPKFFGALRNSFEWKGFFVTANISYKLGYYFRRQSINYTNLFTTWTGNGDYAKRWQHPGDEVHTNVPSLVYPSNTYRDALYQYSQILVDKADNVRLEDVSLGYEFSNAKLRQLHIARARIYLYASNLGLIWAANKDGIDPYYNNTPKVAKAFSGGVNLTF